VQDLDRHKEDFDLANCKVVLISFVGDEGAKKWRAEVGIDEDRYPFLLDHERCLYQQYNMIYFGLFHQNCLTHCYLDSAWKSLRQRFGL